MQRKWLHIPLILFCFTCTHPSWGQDKTIELKDFERDQVKVAGFSLDRDRSITIQAIGAGGKKSIRRTKENWMDKYNMLAYAWIINRETREMVWRMTIENTESVWWDDWSREFDDKVKLEKGNYELYYSAVKSMSWIFDDGSLGFSKILKKIFGDDDWWDEHRDKWMVKISGPDEVYLEQDVKKYQQKMKETAIVDLTGVRNDAYLSAGFTLTRPLQVNVYAIGEAFDGKEFDYGWILDANSRRRVWEMKERHADYAGGAEKNHYIKETITLPTGDYLAYYQSDDSHSMSKWNANPPYDPFFWGLLIRPADEDYDPSQVKTYREAERKPLVSITRVGDYAYKEQAISLDTRTRLRIYAIGEGSSGEMYDYGWITDARTGKIVWKMRYQDTRHAGGASKNRLFDDILTLGQGKYIVKYQTDDSHSYEDWNQRAPQDEENYGITVYTLDDDSQARTIDSNQLQYGNILAELTRIGDDEYVRKQFTINRTSAIRILCLGEGDWDEMYDYGWIKNLDNNETVWRMRYRDTEHAGGARKNRMVDTNLRLEPGNYRVYFRSDDSHSYYDWNDDPPYERGRWGITVYLIDDN